MQVTLTRTFQAAADSRVYQVYSVNIVDVDFERKLHPLLNAGFSESPVGWRYSISADFMPLNGNKEDLIWLQGFMMGSLRQISFEADTFDVTVSSDVDFVFLESTAFGDAFTILFKERSLRYLDDDGSTTRTLRPSYTQGNNVLEADRLTCYSNLVDINTFITPKKVLEFVGGDEDDVPFGFYHKFNVDIGAMTVKAERDWLVEYCLWKNKVFDTTLIDPAGGKVWGVVSDDNSLRFRFIEGLQEVPGISVTLLENPPRIIPEAEVEKIVSTLDNRIIISYSDTTPVTIPDLLLWLKADAIEGLSDGDPVSTWVDSGTGGNDAIQATGGLKPLYKTGILNSLPAVRFDGVDDRMGGTFATSVAGRYSMMFVVKYITLDAGRLNTIFNNLARFGLSVYTFSGLDYEAQGGNGTTYLTTQYHQNLGTPAVGNFLLVEYHRTADSGTGEVFVNKLSAGVKGAGTFAALNGYTLCSYQAGSFGGWLNCDLCEVMVWDRCITSGERSVMRNYLSGKYALGL